MFAHPGKKLTFMGTEIPQFIEWDENRELDWMLLDFPSHYNAHRFAQELNQYYRKTPALWQQDGGWEGFEWHVVDDASHNVFAFLEKLLMVKKCLLFLIFLEKIGNNILLDSMTKEVIKWH